MKKKYFHLLYGESGIGKTTLVQKLHDLVPSSAIHTAEQNITDGNLYDLLYLNENNSKAKIICGKVCETIFKDSDRLSQHTLKGTISTGETQRIAFIRNSLGPKSIKIFDEPFSGVDILSANIVISLIKNMPFFPSAHFIITGHADIFHDIDFRYMLSKNSNADSVISSIIHNMAGSSTKCNTG